MPCARFYKKGSTANIVGRGLGRRRKKNSKSEVIKFSISSSDRFDLLDLPIDSLRSGVGLFVAKGITHALEVSFEGLGHFHDLLDDRRFHTCKPKLKILLCFGE